MPDSALEKECPARVCSPAGLIPMQSKTKIGIRAENVTPTIRTFKIGQPGIPMPIEPCSQNRSGSRRFRGERRGELCPKGISYPGRCGLTACRKSEASKALLCSRRRAIRRAGGWPPIKGTSEYSVIKLLSRMAKGGPEVAESGLWESGR